MNQLIRKTTVALFQVTLLLIVAAAHVHADKAPDNNLDVNRNYLIDKLNRVVTNLAPSDPSKNGIILRLADLLSDRARQTTMLKVDGGCKACPSPEADRKKALQYYHEALPKVGEANKAKVMVQMGHLNQLLGNQAGATELYTRITNESSDPVARAEAFLSIAEMHFKKSDWKQAQSFYEKSIAAGNADSKGYAMYRLGWAEYNLGQINSAKERFLTVLKTPSLLSKNSSNQNVVDAGFHEQVARDYAIICGAGFHESDLKNIYDYSPEKKRLDNLFAVSSELGRTAKRKEALIAWNFFYQNQPQPQERAVAKAHLGTVNLQLGQNAEALKDFNEAYSLIVDKKTQFPNETEDVRRLIKSSIITWNQAEKKKPSPELLEAYQGYLSNFGFEKEMSQWAVQIAGELNKWETAWTIHQQATENVATGKNAKVDLENHLLLGVELGESSKNSTVLAQAQKEYLARSQSKTKYWEVFYQQTYAGYEKAENEDFLKSLSAVVMAKDAPLDLRVKSGDLYLDYLASKKRDAEIEVQARVFHKTLTGIKGYQSDWAKIAEKSVLNQVAQAVQDNKLDQAWTKIQDFEIKSADTKDVVTYYKNKTIIAEKRNDIVSALAAAKSMNALAVLDKEDKIFAQAKMAYYSDLRMDFKSAKTLTEQLPESVLPADKKNLKLAMYSDLLGQDSATYLKKFVDVSQDQKSKEVAVLEIIKKTPGAAVDVEIKKQEKNISKSYETLGQLAAISYLANGNKSYGLQMAQKNPEVQKTPQGNMIINDQKLTALGAFGDEIQKLSLDSDITKKDFQKKLARDMQARAKALNKLDELAADAIKTKDWTLQVLSLSLIARESERFYTEILSLPMPDGLTPEEQGEYMRLLGERAQPYKTKAEQALAKANEFLDDSTWVAQLGKKLSGPYAVIAEREKNQLLKVADEKNKSKLMGLAGTTAVAKKDVAATESRAIAVADIETAKADVKNEPFNVSKIQTLKDMESKNGNLAMVQYLEGRINDLKTDREVDAKGVQ